MCLRSRDICVRCLCFKFCDCSVNDMCYCVLMSFQGLLGGMDDVKVSNGGIDGQCC